jgi:hypothetical protein
MAILREEMKKLAGRDDRWSKREFIHVRALFRELARRRSLVILNQPPRSRATTPDDQEQSAVS